MNQATERRLASATHWLADLARMVGRVLTDSQLDHAECGRTIRATLGPVYSFLDGDVNAGWTRAADELPRWDGEPMFGFERSVPVLVTDGHNRPALAYAQHDPDDGWTGWKLDGRDGYDVPFPVVYWHALPSLPSLPVVED